MAVFSKRKSKIISTGIHRSEDQPQLSPEISIPSPEPKCKNCRYCNDTETEMRCHRYPKRPYIEGEMRDGDGGVWFKEDYPKCYSYDWCGEFKPKE